MYGPGRPYGGGSGRRAPFTGGIWAGSNPFLNVGGRSSRNGPARGSFFDGYDDYDDHDRDGGFYRDYSSRRPDPSGMGGQGGRHRSVSVQGPRRGGTGGFSGDHEPRDERRPGEYYEPRGAHRDSRFPGESFPGDSYSYTSIRDSNGNVYEEGYGPQGPFRNTVRDDWRLDGANTMDRLDGLESMFEDAFSDFGERIHHTHRPHFPEEAFPSTFFTSRTPFGPPSFDNRNDRSSRGDMREQGIQPNGQFAFEFEPARERPDTGPSENSGERIASFLARHTEPLTAANTTEQTNEECPICIEKADAHPCVKIKDVEGCPHMIGKSCLQELLERNPDDKKECPLCRAVWLPENGIWQDSQEWRDMADWNGLVDGWRTHHHDHRRPRRSVSYGPHMGGGWYGGGRHGGDRYAHHRYGGGRPGRY